jgi:hypothetical protein
MVDDVISRRYEILGDDFKFSFSIFLFPTNGNFSFVKRV